MPGYVQCLIAKTEWVLISSAPAQHSAQACTLMQNMQQLIVLNGFHFFKLQASTTAILVLYSGSINIWLLLQAWFVNTTRRG